MNRLLWCLGCFAFGGCNSDYQHFQIGVAGIGKFHCFTQQHLKGVISFYWCGITINGYGACSIHHIVHFFNPSNWRGPPDPPAGIIT